MLKKATLLEAIAGKNRGLLATESDKTAILSAIAQLEDYNPTPRPVEALELLDGNWRLLYTNSQELLGIDRFPFYNLGQIYQCIRARTGKIYNIAEIVGIPYLEGMVSVAARFEAVSQKRVQVKFNRFVIGLQRLISYQYPNQFIDEIESDKKFLAVDFTLQEQQQQGWLDITYLDEDMRIGRGNVGSVFVLTKVK
ncbi:MAG: PAP/fibrillin family protein [Limnospira sp. PMC 1286.21]|uniref:PAP fibrillin family protein n=2 Tax=Limnospira TaxID=2596745 RepID=B5W0K3_LIMMA|nr:MULTISPECIES: PAP/fibrillin family protein [Limnospira]AMW30419.1 fibrillin [Arthrospira platensis YZ]EKD06193.1 PAP fibrillin family protein [Arthrospira platensis C1]MDC0840468.1 PAP/fibrillin family protein [Limnoraphis robusta]MDY7055376.1 PAP/fibrillin family protein [Limnospira fusiformis LS22]QJB26738.1 fibrillin [Limnospira fusiformis SAG 85.79]